MENTYKIINDLYYIGASLRKLSLFENVYPIPQGASYNSYLLLDDKKVLFDTIDKSLQEQFFENLEGVLDGSKLDYLVLHHIEPDHSSMIKKVVEMFPEIKIVCNLKTKQMLYQFFDFNSDIENNFQIVKEGDKLNTGRHELTFYMAPMVHWPEVMVSFDTADKILFSADAFGSFGALDGNIFDCDTDFDSRIPEYRRYYSNIVGKYGAQVKMLLAKLSNLDVKMICPLHGVILKDNISKMIEKYTLWASYTPEEKSVLLAYGSIYGNTQNAAEVLAKKLALGGLKNIKMYDVSAIHPSYIISDIFKYSHIVLASATYNNSIFVNMENLVNSIAEHNIQNRAFAIIENGSWAPASANLIKEKLEKIPNTKFIEDKITIKSSLKNNQADELEKISCAIINDIK